MSLVPRLWACLILALALVSGMMADDSQGPWRLGTAQETFAVPEGIGLFGYGFREGELGRGHQGILDPIGVRVLVVTDPDGERFLLASLDICVIPTALADQWRRKISRRFEVPRDRVWLVATHTHSAPFIATDELAKAWRLPEVDGVVPEVEFAAEVEAALMRACARAVALSYPSTLAWQHAPLGIAFDRRVRLPDGSIAMCWEPQEFPDRVPEPAIDPWTTILVLRQIGGPRETILWNVGAHPVVLGKTSNVVSADFPGNANARLEAERPDRFALFVNAACGHNQPWVSTQDRPRAVAQVGKVAASFVDLLVEGVRPADTSGGIRSASESVTTGGGEIEVTAVALGDVTFAAVPVELFGELALPMREATDGPLILATMTNGWETYLPDEPSFADGAYEVGIAKRKGFQPGDGEKVRDSLIGLIQSLASAG